MEGKAVARYMRVSPRKARQIIDLIRGKEIDEALAILRYTPNKSAAMIEKVLKSAIANAEHNFDMNTERLYVAKTYVDPGPTLKRIQARAQGRADRVMRRTSHITVIVKEK
jgi:large subunit ribosomal protein L22